MATSAVAPQVEGSQAAQSGLLISLASLSRESFEQTLGNVAQAFGPERVIVATPDANSETTRGAITVTGYTPAVPSQGGWTLTAADFLNARELAQKHQARTILMLGSEAQSLAPETLRRLATAIAEGADLALPRYALPPRAGLVNSALLYPISRALFGAAPRFPLALDLGMSARMTERIATAAQRFTAINELDALLWPVAEASVAGFSLVQVEAGPRMLPQPAGQDLNSVLALVAGSLFADVDAKAAFWQRSRVAVTVRANAIPSAPQPGEGDEVQSMIDAFRLAYGNLHEIWSLVLPPQSLLGLKRLSIMPAESFLMPDSLWARIVYDFLLAFRLRTINRGHLLGALTPLYLAWVASHIRQTGAGVDSERHIETLAAAFETDKPYLVSRWRWPDRFNP
jgi:hypothetical protein